MSKRSNNRIIHDERTYIESIGKQDNETVREALADRGADTILRVCIGVSGKEMPLRALGYYASAIAVQEHYFPEAELQFVFPVRAAEKVNGVDQEKGRYAAQGLDLAARGAFPRRYRETSPEAAEIKSLVEGDFNVPSSDLVDAVAEVLADQPELSQRFQTAANARGSEFASYVAAHVLMHDTSLALSPLIGAGSARPTSERVISIGAQSERPFYLARMACQRAKVLPEDVQVATGQLFTRHVIPPYLSCREGEPVLAQSMARVAHPIPSVQRDLEYLRDRLGAEADHYQSMGEAVTEKFGVGLIAAKELV